MGRCGDEWNFAGLDVFFDLDGELPAVFGQLEGFVKISKQLHFFGEPIRRGAGRHLVELEHERVLGPLDSL